jgi:ubiquitin-protein ligase E3 A
MDDDDKKAFLKFLTGSSRIPIGGLGCVKLTISRNSEIFKLPWVSTCSNILFLPDYKEEGVLQEKLKSAMYGSEGFDFI